MSRIFLSLALVATVLLTIAFWLGLRIDHVNATYREFIATREKLQAQADTRLSDDPELVTLRARRAEQLKKLAETRPRVTTHTMFGMLTALCIMLVHSVCVTYFIGTAKWCGEVVGAYQLDDVLYQECRQLKRNCFWWSLLGIAALLVVVVLGASADPSTLGQQTWRWVEPHLWAAATCLAITLIAFWKQWEYLLQNVRLVQAIEAQVQQVRARHGLDA